MKIAHAAVLGLATVAATGCDREPTSRTAYNNSGASAIATAPDQIAAPPPPNIAPPPQGLAIPTYVPSEPAQANPAVQPAAGAPGTTPSVTPTMPDTASPAVPPVTPPAANTPGAAR